MAHAFADLLNEWMNLFIKFIECAKQSKEAEHTGSPLSATSQLQNSDKYRHPGPSSDLDVLKISILSCNVAERSITWLLMLKNLPETSTIKREVQPNKRHIGESSRRPVMASKMPIKISPRRRFMILLTKSRNFFAFWVWCCENCTGIIKRRSLHNLQGSLLQKAAAYIDD